MLLLCIENGEYQSSRKSVNTTREKKLSRVAKYHKRTLRETKTVSPLKTNPYELFFDGGFSLVGSVSVPLFHTTRLS